MRVTCLKCGSQFEVAHNTSSTEVNCECGPEFRYPEVQYAGVQPSQSAAERLRYRAFHSAGLVSNSGMTALYMSAISVLVFPIALLGIGVGLYTLVVKRGPLGRYVGRRQAGLAVVLGVVVFCAEGALLLSFLKDLEVKRIASLQESIRDDLRGLLRTQRLYRAAKDRYGLFRDFPHEGFQPMHGHYTIYLDADDFIPASRDGVSVIDALSGPIVPEVSDHAFTAIAVANLDSDPHLDVWLLNHEGEQFHIVDDNDNAPDTRRDSNGKLSRSDGF